MDATKHILVVEDDPLIAEDIRGYLLEFGHQVLGPVASRAEAQTLISRHKPDAAVLDIHLGDIPDEGCVLAAWINANHPMPFIFLSSHADAATLAKAKGCHPGGYLLKPFTGPEIQVALEIALCNWHDPDGPRAMPFDPVAVDRHLPEPLSEREREVARCLCEGLSNKVIADRLYLSENTVKTHLQRLFSKLEVKQRTEAVHQLRELSLR
jgi:DNA-binding NarL/FixJ family response regulator